MRPQADTTRMARHILVIDQGTTSTRRIVFDAAVAPVATAQQEFAQIYPRPGWVEHDPRRSGPAVLATARQALVRRRACAPPTSPPSASPTSARRWWSGTAAPASAIHNAIVWQDRRTADACERLEDARATSRWSPRAPGCCSIRISPRPRSPGCSTMSTARARPPRPGHLAFGTVDSFLLWRLTGGAVHATDATNASRTLLFDIHRGDWDEDLLALFGIPARHAARGARQRRRHSATRRPALFGGADRHPRHRRRSAGGADRPGLLPARHGQIHLRHRLLRAAQHRAEGDRQPPPPADHDRLPVERRAHLCARGLDLRRRRRGAVAARRPRPDRIGRRDRHLAAEADPAQPVYLVPAFVGLGAPHWDSEARGAADRHDPRHDAAGTGPRGAGMRRLPDPRPAGRDAGRPRRRLVRRHRRSAWMAA